MLCKTGCVSGCQISTTHTRQATSSKKQSYTLACQHGRTYESRTAITFTPGTVGPNNVIGEKMKRHKARRSKGKVLTPSRTALIYMYTNHIFADSYIYD